MRKFKWIDWNVKKIGDHGLSADEVEAAFDHVYKLTCRKDGSFEMLAQTPSARTIWVIWRYDREEDWTWDALVDEDVPIFVITAY